MTEKTTSDKGVAKGAAKGVAKGIAKGTSRKTRSTIVRAEELPLYTYKDYTPQPCVVYTRNEDEANDFIQLLKGPLGFDMEWRFSFRGKGIIQRPTALIQFSDEKMILLVQISAMPRFPQKVKEVIESPDVIKIGANIGGDGNKLYRDFGILPKSLLELGALAKTADSAFTGRRVHALAKTVALYEKKTLGKGPVRSSNWEAVLSEKQKEYAASDAHCALMVYKRLMKIAEEQNCVVDPREVATDIQGSVSSLSDKPSNISSASTPRQKNQVVGSSSGITPPAAPPALLDRAENVSTASSSSVATSATAVSNGTALPRDDLSESSVAKQPGISAQCLRAYNLWHYQQVPLPQICTQLRSPENPLKDSTVINYIVRALQFDPSLQYSISRLKELVEMDPWAMRRSKFWLAAQERRAGLQNSGP
ncbi:ribonuclease H-like protein [Heliocybe sulcata]|uniref:Ribonuclease H-like protein n=1 Tax=Heliocybe sulcata TaxID=5364 RepID=A0A5C3N766_9AGAM|nr:ribonuclease H-like protein [Heliocybe sulcata]